jgi:hypothetical protein
VTYHRLLTHRGFKMAKPLEYLGTFFGMLASEGGAITWVAMHRVHHAQSDRPGKDMHTPKDGFFWSHFGWIICKTDMDHRQMDSRYAPELMADPVHRVLNRLHVFPNILVGLAFFAWGGWPLVIWGVFLRLVIVLNTTWLVNSATHTWGYRTYQTPEGSRNLWWVGLLAWARAGTTTTTLSSAPRGTGWPGGSSTRTGWSSAGWAPWVWYGTSSSCPRMPSASGSAAGTPRCWKGPWPPSSPPRLTSPPSPRSRRLGL